MPCVSAERPGPRPVMLTRLFEQCIPDACDSPRLGGRLGACPPFRRPATSCSQPDARVLLAVPGDHLPGAADLVGDPGHVADGWSIRRDGCGAATRCDAGRRRTHAAMPTPVIMDVDTGIDDAFALMFAVRHPAIDLRAVTCVAGNTGVDQVRRQHLLRAGRRRGRRRSRSAGAPRHRCWPPPADAGQFHGGGRARRVLPAVRPAQLAAGRRSTCCGTSCRPRSANGEQVTVVATGAA